jgi:hypothetical protein
MDEARKARLARAQAYADGTRDAFRADVELAMRYLVGVPDGGVLAGPVAKQPRISTRPLKKNLKIAKEATYRADRKKTST